MVVISQTKLQVLTQELAEPFNLDLTCSLIQIWMTSNLVKAFYFTKNMYLQVSESHLTKVFPASSSCSGLNLW